MKLKLVIIAALALMGIFAAPAVARAQVPPEPAFDCAFIDTGTSGDDPTFQGTIYNDCYSALGGNDIAAGFSGHDRFDMGSGNDQACGGNCSGDGGDVQDVLKGISGRDLLIGDGGNDFIYGGTGIDDLRGGADDDTIAACDGEPDRVRGDGGRNVCYLDRLKDDWGNCDEKHFC